MDILKDSIDNLVLFQLVLQIIFPLSCIKRLYTSNWDKRDYIVQGINDEVMDEKINYFPLGVGQFPDSEPFPNPARGKKILLFNHRWNNSTGINKLIEYTEDLDRDEWLVWVTDENAKKLCMVNLTKMDVC